MSPLEDMQGFWWKIIPGFNQIKSRSFQSTCPDFGRICVSMTRDPVENRLYDLPTPTILIYQFFFPKFVRKTVVEPTKHEQTTRLEHTVDIPRTSSISGICSKTDVLDTEPKCPLGKGISAFTQHQQAIDLSFLSFKCRSHRGSIHINCGQRRRMQNTYPLSPNPKLAQAKSISQ